MSLPILPADCFGIAVPRMVKCVDSGVLDATDKTETVDGVLMVETESVHWFSGRKAKASAVAVENIHPDFIVPELSHTKPGSPERIAALQAFYANNKPEDGFSESDGNEWPSPFTLTDSDVADRLINALSVMLTKNRNSLQDQME
jgi:hypothetical protein